MKYESSITYYSKVNANVNVCRQTDGKKKNLCAHNLLIWRHKESQCTLGDRATSKRDKRAITAYIHVVGLFNTYGIMNEMTNKDNKIITKPPSPYCQYFLFFNL